MSEQEPADRFAQRRMETALSDEAVVGRARTLFFDDGRLKDFGEDQFVTFIMERYSLDQSGATKVMNQSTFLIIRSIIEGVVAKRGR